MNREQEIITITQRKVGRGVSADEQYANLNAAREKRKRKRTRNVQVILSGGYKQIPILNS